MGLDWELVTVRREVHTVPSPIGDITEGEGAGKERKGRTVERGKREEDRTAERGWRRRSKTQPSTHSFTVAYLYFTFPSLLLTLSGSPSGLGMRDWSRRFSVSFVTPILNGAGTHTYAHTPTHIHTTHKPPTHTHTHTHKHKTHTQTQSYCGLALCRLLLIIIHSNNI